MSTLFVRFGIVAAGLLVVVPLGDARGQAQQAESSEPANKPTPEAVAQLYFDDLKAGRYEQMTDRMHPDALEAFKKFMLPIAEAADEDGQWESLTFLFGDIETVDQLRQTPPKKFFLAFFSSVVKIAPQIRSIFDDAKVELIGHVMEKETAHVIARLNVNVNDVEITKMIVISLKPTEDGWGVLLSAEIDGFAQSLKRRFL